MVDIWRVERTIIWLLYGMDTTLMRARMHGLCTFSASIAQLSKHLPGVLGSPIFLPPEVHNF